MDTETVSKAAPHRAISVVEPFQPLVIIKEYWAMLTLKRRSHRVSGQEGARAGIVYASPSRVSDAEIKAVVINYCQDNLVTFGSGVLNAGSITVGRTSDLSGDPLTVTVNYNYDFLVMPSFINSLLGGIQLSANTVMRME